MIKNIKTVAFFALLICSVLKPTNEVNMPSKTMGVFTHRDPRLEGLTWGNWGSRPYEYQWVKDIVSITNKKVIDLGVGLPSQYNWFSYVVKRLKPAFYAGIDADTRILQECQAGANYEIRFMDMAQLAYEDKSFDIAYCISTFEHIAYDAFIKTIQEAHRVLKDDGLLIVTLDEEWDKNMPQNYHNGWNTLEQSLMQKSIFTRTKQSFGLPHFLVLVKDYFVPVADDAVINAQDSSIVSTRTGACYYKRNNRDEAILNSGDLINSCVSYVVLKKRK